MDYVELHASSAFSFLRGATPPENLAAEAARLGLPALAVLDRDGVYGTPRLYQAARELGLRAIVGAEVTMENGSALPLLVMNATGYSNLCRLISTAKLEPRLGRAATDERCAQARNLVRPRTHELRK